jgi:hypothetical protein
VCLSTPCIHHAYDVRSHALFDHFSLIRAEAKQLAMRPRDRVSSIVCWGSRGALHIRARRSHTRRGSIRGLKGGGRFRRCCEARTVLNPIEGQYDSEAALRKAQRQHVQHFPCNKFKRVCRGCVRWHSMIHFRKCYIARLMLCAESGSWIKGA